MMFPKADAFRLDWRSEFDRLRPFLDGSGGVVRIDFLSEDAAAGKFSHILKEDFATRRNGPRLSLRIDAEWSTTFTLDDQIDAFAKKLDEAGISVSFPEMAPAAVDILSGNHAGRDLTIYAPGLTIELPPHHLSSAMARKRIAAICDGLRRFVQGGGQFMVVVNDMPQAGQGHFWRKFWQQGLAEAGGEGLLLIYFVGPKCGGRPHDDAPAANLRLTLPVAIEGDEIREGHIYDDIIDLFVQNGHSDDKAIGTANALIANNGHSVQALQEGLSKTIWRMDNETGRRRG